MTEAVIGVMQLQAKGRQGLLAASRSWGTGLEQSLPQSIRKEPTLPAPKFMLLASRDVREYVSVVLSCPVYDNSL